MVFFLNAGARFIFLQVGRAPPSIFECMLFSISSKAKEIVRMSFPFFAKQEVSSCRLRCKRSSLVSREVSREVKGVSLLSCCCRGLTRGSLPLPRGKGAFFFLVKLECAFLLLSMMRLLGVTLAKTERRHTKR